MKRIAIISTNKSQYSETFIRNQVQHLPFEMLVLSNGYLPKEFSSDRGKTFQEIPLKKSDPKANLKRFLKKHSPDAVLVQYGPSAVEVLPVIQKLKLPMIVHFHGYDAYRDDILNSYGNSYSAIFDEAAAVIAVSADMKRQLIHLGCPESKLHQIKYGVDVNQFVPAEVKSEQQFVSCGRFVEKKSPQTTIEAFSKMLQKHPGTKLVMVGDGPLLADCKQKVESLGIEDKVEFKGVLNQEEIIPLLQKSLAFVQHSVKSENNDSEGTPLSIIEAALCGLAVVSTNHAGIPEVIEHDFNGLLCDQNDTDAMAANMIRLIENPELADKMGRASRERIAKEYSLEQYIQRLTEILESCISG